MSCCTASVSNENDVGATANDDNDGVGGVLPSGGVDDEEHDTAANISSRASSVGMRAMRTRARVTRVLIFIAP